MNKKIVYFYFLMSMFNINLMPTVDVNLMLTVEVTKTLIFDLWLMVRCQLLTSIQHVLPTGDTAGKMSVPCLVLINVCLSIRALVEVKHALRI